MNNEAPPRKKRGCLFYGCLSLIIVGLLLIALFVGVFFTVKRTIFQYTDTAPQTIESAPYSAAEWDALQKRITEFQTALNQGKGGQELILSATDLNAWIARQPELNGKLFAMIEDDKLRGKVSVPLPDIGPLKLKGRYLNGMATFKASLTNSALRVSLEDVQVKSNPPPAMVLTKLKQTVQDYQNGQQPPPELQKLESIRIEDGRIILKTKGNP